MTAHIQRFVDRVRACEQRGQRELVLSLSEAKDLHADITKLLAIIQDLHERSQATTVEPTINTEISGGAF